MHSTDPDSSSRVLRGTLQMLILKTLLLHGPLHGYGISKKIQERSDDVLQVEEGSLYPALQRLLVSGCLESEWDFTEGGRKARYYRITPEGRQQLRREVVEFHRVVEATRRVLQPV